MGRTNYVILGLGLASCLALSFMMEHVLLVRKDRKIPPIVTHLTKQFGSRFVGPPSFRVSGSAPKRVATVTVQPLIGLSIERFAQDTGEFVWNRIGVDRSFDELLVVCDTGLGDKRTFRVAPPLSAGRVIQEIRAPETETARPAGR